MKENQFADPEVSKTKYNRELEEFKSLEFAYRQQGWMLVKATFPEVIIVLAAPQLKPPAIVTGVRFDFTNYDVRPPSVRLVDPFTGQPYRAKELPIHLMRASQQHNVQMPGPVVLQMTQAQDLMQSYGPEDIPFLCLAGVREYHDHPGHSGDDWELHRSSGAGRLVRLLNTISKYGIQPISDYNVKLVPSISFLVRRDQVPV